MSKTQRNKLTSFVSKLVHSIIHQPKGQAVPPVKKGSGRTGYDYSGGFYPYVSPNNRCRPKSKVETENDENDVPNSPKVNPAFVELDESIQNGIYDVPKLMELQELTEEEISVDQAFYVVDRRNATLMLLRPDVDDGTYLLRPCSDQHSDSLVLSIRSTHKNGGPIVYHCKVIQFFLTEGEIILIVFFVTVQSGSKWPMFFDEWPR